MSLRGNVSVVEIIFSNIIVIANFCGRCKSVL